ncbi:MAG: hypothetical protein O9264_12150 [Leptospira sp.]|nr:hypothetical protein [Leptospira sp.]
MANLRALTEEGGFYSAKEPLPFVILLFWKQITGLNYIPAFLSLAGFFYSLFVHLFLLLLRRDSWGRNHYLLAFLAVFFPISYSFPTEYFPETVCLVFILLVFLTFRMEKITDLIVFPLLTLLAFFSSFTMFFLGFSFFVLFSGVRGARKQAQKTSVFYKKKNVPFIMLTSYMGFFILCLLLFSYFDFLGPHSIQSLANEWWSITKVVVLPLLVLGIGHILLKTEKELNTYTASVVSLILIAVSMFFIYRDLRKTEEPWEAKTTSITKAYGQASILKSDPIYLPKEFSFALYFLTKTKTHYLRNTTESPKSFQYVTDIWSQDVISIQKSLLGKKGGRVLGLVSLGEDSILIQKSVLERMKGYPALSFLVKKIEDSWESSPSLIPYHKYTRGLQEKFGYNSFY